MVIQMIYFIQGEKTRLIKIGYSKEDRIVSRLVEIQSLSPDILTLLKIIEGDTSAEASLHRQFKELRCHGEWFKTSKRLLSFIKSLPSADLDIEDSFMEYKQKN